MRLSRSEWRVTMRFVIADVNAQDGQTELIRAVAECLLHLCRGHIRACPFRQIDAAEAADALKGLVGIDIADARR